MTYGLMMITDLKELDESKRRLFRKKREKLIRRTSLKRIKNGVYLIPFEKPVPSESEIQDYERVESLMREFQVKADHFFVTQVEEPEHQAQLSPNDIMSKLYFVLRPIKVLRRLT